MPYQRVKEIKDLLAKAMQLSGQLQQKADELDKLSTEAVDHGQEDNISDDAQAAKFGRYDVMPVMRELRQTLDQLESITDRPSWPIASYQDILHQRHEL